MDDESVDLYDDSAVGTDDPGENMPAEDETGSGTDIPDSDSASDDLEGLITDILDEYFKPDEPAGIDGDGVTGSETGDGSETDNASDTDETAGDNAGMTEEESPDSEILSEMKDTLHIHTENVQSFFSDTVSGNAVVVTLDDNAAALLNGSLENQAVAIDHQSEILDRLDVQNSFAALLFVVLCFDMIHRFAKRIVRNFMRGDGKSGTNI